VREAHRATLQKGPRLMIIIYLFF